MTKLGKTFLCIAFSFMFVFMTIGYAALSDTLLVSGLADVREPEGLYITSVEVSGTTGNATAKSHEFKYPTNVKSTIDVGRTSVRGNTVTYAITVKNNTRYKYSYRGAYAVEDLEAESSYNNNYFGTGNSAISIATREEASTTSAVFDKNDVVLPGQTRTFYATYTVGRNLAGTSNTNKKSYTTFIKYQFGIHIDSLGDIAAERIIKKFGEILNTKSTYDDLTEHIDDKYVNQGWQSNYIGNVVGATSSDTVVIERLFGDELVLNIDDQEAKVTIMIKRTNVDDNTNTGDSYTAVNGNNRHTEDGCEMTLYITTNDLDKTIEDGEYSGARDWADVYVAVFTCDKKSDGSYSDWYHIGGIYDGIAPMVSYDGSTNGTGSFITDDWTPLQTTYQVTGSYSYTVRAGDGRNDGREDIRDIMAAKDVAANNEFNRLLAEAKEALAYIDANEDYFQHEVFQEHIAKLRAYVADAERVTVNNNTRRVELIQHMQKLENGTYPFLEYIN